MILGDVFMAFLKTLIFIFLIITPFDSLSQTAQPTRNSHPEKSLIYLEHYIENKNVHFLVQLKPIPLL